MRSEEPNQLNEKKLMLGNEAIARGAIEAGVRFVTLPGVYPCAGVVGNPLEGFDGSAISGVF